MYVVIAMDQNVGSSTIDQSMQSTRRVVTGGSDGSGLRKGSSHGQDDQLRVHIVPHSHDDSGWLKTFLQYYWGDQQQIQSAGVQYILDSIVDALMQDDRRRFSYAEMSFFMIWWQQQDEGRKEVVRELVKQRRLDFVNGGFVQHDEAASHYVAMIDQTTRGHKFLKQEFGFVPRVGWQIDPFGHSSTQAGLMGSVLGFDAMFFGRADWEDMKSRKESKSLEFVWEGSGGAPKDCRRGSEEGLFVGNFASGNYGPPKGFNFELSISDAPIQDDPSLFGYNVPQRVSEFIQRCEELAAITRGPDIMLTMGSDFHYSAAASWFKNLDKLMDAVNEHSQRNTNSTKRRISVFYSTPHEYVKAKASYDKEWPVKVDDFFPYSDAVEAFWTGYFTSRPTSKRYIRQATSFLQAARQLEAFLDLTGARDNEGDTDLLEEAVALCQHHDSITGTEKQAVANDYHMRIHMGIIKAQMVVARAFETLVAGASFVGRKHNIGPKFEFCDLVNISICEPTVRFSADDVDTGMMVTVYNPSSFERDIPIFVPVSLSRAESWEVIGPDGERIPSDVVKFSKTTKKLQKYHYGDQERKILAEANIAFVAPVEGLGYAVYEIRPVWEIERFRRTLSSNEKFSISNEHLTVNFDARSGRVSSVLQDGISIPFTCDLLWYNSSDGLHSDVNRGQSSGAYIFRPNGKTHLLPTDRPISLDIVHGEIVSEARLVYNSWGSLTLRLYRGKKFLEAEWTIGPLPDDNIGREVVVSYGTSSKIKSNGSLWTDANGRSMIRRVRNQRLSWDSEWASLDAGNFYPMTSAAYIADSDLVLSLVTDRSQGVASFEDGEMEIMLHRRTVVDDRRGVEEPLNEEHCVDDKCVGLLATGRHRVQFSMPEFAAVERRLLQQEVTDDPIIAFSGILSKENQLLRSHSFLPRDAQMNFPLHILTLKTERREDGDLKILLRIAHQMDAPEGAVRAFVGTSALVDLVHNIGCDLIDTKELSLSTNQEINDMKRLQFATEEAIGDVTCSAVFGEGVNSQRQFEKDANQGGRRGNDAFFTFANDLHLDPMQIRTFEIKCAPMTAH